MDSKKRLLGTVTLFVVLGLALAVVLIFFSDDTELAHIDSAERLESVDFSTQIVQISFFAFREFANQLIAPDGEFPYSGILLGWHQVTRAQQEQIFEEFRQQQYEATGIDIFYHVAPYATHKLVLTGLETGATYTFTGRTNNQALYMWVDGEKLLQIGTVGTSPEETGLVSREFSIDFTATAEQAEIVIWRASFGEYHTRHLPLLTFGKQELMDMGLGFSGIAVMVIVGIAILAVLTMRPRPR